MALCGRKSIIENNIVQTIASGVNGAASGMMFSVPAIFLLGFGDNLIRCLLTFGCIAGAYLGIAFIIPLRKHMIDYERLTYPGGVAVATILEVARCGRAKGDYAVDGGGDSVRACTSQRSIRESITGMSATCSVCPST